MFGVMAASGLLYRKKLKNAKLIFNTYILI
jgi:hypothetical protein